MTTTKLPAAALLAVAWIWGMLPAGSIANTVYQANDIPLLDNRFRIDPDVEEVTVVIHRRSNNSPAILVRPDGSKWYAWRHPADTVRWLDSDRYDIITIKDPMPGPWQAIAEFNVINRVRLLSRTELQVSPLPMKLYAGERLKLTASFQRQGKTLPGEEYLDRLALSARLVSYQRPEDENFSVKDITLSRLQDSGAGYDEYPLDGIYTYGILLRVPAGKYKFIVAAANDVMARAYQQDVLLYPEPIQLAVESTEVGQPLELEVMVDGDELQLASVAYRGQVEGVGDMAPLRLSGVLASAKLRIPLPAPPDSGHYRLNMTWVATTLDGREVVIEPPEVRFTLFDPVTVPPPASSLQEPQPVVPESTSRPLAFWLALLAGSLLGVGLLAGILVWWLKRRNTRAMLLNAEAGDSHPVVAEPQPATISREEIDLNKLIGN